jgi:hypothetical protein
VIERLICKEDRRVKRTLYPTSEGPLHACLGSLTLQRPRGMRAAQATEERVIDPVEID